MTKSEFHQGGSGREDYQQSIHLENSSLTNSNQTINVYTDSDTQRIREKWLSDKERTWTERYENLQSKLAGGYRESVREELSRLLVEIDNHVKQGEPINSTLQARIYRLSAVAFLPRYVDGNVKQCQGYLESAKEISVGEDLEKCVIVESLLLFDTNQITEALVLLSGISTEEAIRLRFAIYIDTQNLEQCQAMLVNNEVDANWRNKSVDWARAFLGYFALARDKEEAIAVAETFTATARTPSAYQISGICLLSIAHEQLRVFGQNHDVFPDFYIGLDLEDLVDSRFQVQASIYFAKAAELYAEHDCINSAIEALSSAILLSLESSHSHAHLHSWVQQLRSLDPAHPLLIELRSPKYQLEDTLGNPPSLLDFTSVLNHQSIDLGLMLRIARTISDTPSRALEIATALEDRIGGYQLTDSDSVHYVFTVLQLWLQSQQPERGLAWLESTTEMLPHPRFRMLLYSYFHFNEARAVEAVRFTEEALQSYPNHPEVLAASYTVYYRFGHHQQALLCAEALLEILTTRQTVEQYIVALRSLRDFSGIVTFLSGNIGEVADPYFVHGNRADALVQLERLTDAQEDFEWLRSNELARAHHLYYLGYSYILKSNYDDAIEVLNECIKKNPDAVEAYNLLSDAYLYTGRRGKSFEVALTANKLFPDNVNTSENLLNLSFPTGMESRPEVRNAFVDLLPTGRFAEQSPFIAISTDEFSEWYKNASLEDMNLENLYKLGKLPRSLFCLLRNTTVFLDHLYSNTVGQPRYVAHSDQHLEINSLLSNQPTEVALDYSALLTLWSLLGEGLLEFLRNCFQVVHVPEQLRTILLYEHDHITKTGQLEWHLARSNVHSFLSDWSHPIVRHTKEEIPANIRTITEAEKAVAKQNDLAYFCEYSRDNEDSNVPTIGVVALADLFEQDGYIDSLTKQNLIRDTQPSTDNEQNLCKDLNTKRDILVNPYTLIHWARHANLDSLVDYFDKIHVLDLSVTILRQEIEQFSLKSRAEEEINQLRELLARGEKENLIVFWRAEEDHYLLRRKHDKETETLGEKTGYEIIWRLNMGCLDELLDVTYSKNIPLWADDFFTKGLKLNERRPQFSFSTDSLLAYVHRSTFETPLTTTEYYSYCGKLVDWGYYFLYVDPQHIIWHLLQGRTPKHKLLAQLLENYRGKVVEFWRLARESLDQGEQLGTKLLGYYHRQLTAVMLACFNNDVSSSVAADIFAELDLSRHGGSLIIGNEPQLFASLFTHAILKDNDSVNSEEAHVLNREPEYSNWLHEVIRQSGVAHELVDEAWYQLVRYPLAMYDEAETDQQRTAAILFIDQILKVSPIETKEYLLTTDIGDQLQADFGVHIYEVLSFRVKEDSENTFDIQLPAQQWYRDYQNAIRKYVSNTSVATATAGLVTIKAEKLSPGSVFVRSTVVPTEIHLKHPNLSDPTNYICLLAGFSSRSITHRKSLWKIGLEALRECNLPQEHWHKKRRAISILSAEGMSAGVAARRHLLGIWPIAEMYLSQAASVSSGSIMQYLELMEPDIAAKWIDLPDLDWSSKVGLESWASQDAFFRISVDQRTVALADRYILHCYSLFLDSQVLRKNVLTQVLQFSRHEQMQFIEYLMHKGQTTHSFVLKANVALFIYNWLHNTSHKSKSSVSRQDEQRIVDQLKPVILSILTGYVNPDESEPELSVLESLLNRWLYRKFSNSGVRNAESSKFAYLSTLAAGRIVDIIGNYPEIVDKLVQQLIEVLRPQEIFARIEPQPSGFFRPVLRTSINYPAAYLLHGVLIARTKLFDFGDDVKLLEALLRCSIQHKIQQTFIPFSDIQETWLDQELSVDVSSACIETLGGAAEIDTKVWFTEERHYSSIVAALSEALELAQSTAKSLRQFNNEDELLRRLDWLFQGRIQPSKRWFSAIAELFREEILVHIRKFPKAYTEFMAHISLIVIHPSSYCPSELLVQMIHELTSIPEDNQRELIEIKSHVLSYFLRFGLEVKLVHEWITKVVEASTAIARLALRPFILSWEGYNPSIREDLYKTLSKVAEGEEYRNLWELKRLERQWQASKTRLQKSL